jgi:uncharacterized protein YjiS (DUF1127 family)
MANSLVSQRPQPLSLAALWQWPRLWLERQAEREALAELGPEQLQDCGLDPLTVRREATKPFWRD